MNYMNYIYTKGGERYQASLETPPMSSTAKQTQGSIGSPWISRQLAHPEDFELARLHNSHEPHTFLHKYTGLVSPEVPKASLLKPGIINSTLKKSNCL